MPVLVISWILATIEKFFHKRLKGTVDFMLTPLLTLLITGFITFAAIGPVSGKVMVTFPTKHAYAMRGFDAEGNKVDILMHIGFDTVNLKGAHFTSLVNKGDEVQQGDTLAEFDIEAIKAAGYPVTTPVVISNSKKTGPVLPAEGFRDGQPISFGAPLLTVDPKIKDEPKSETAAKPAVTAEKK